jgi:hypothetical protein
MPDQNIFSIKQNGNRNEQLACRVLEKNGIKTVNDLKQFISENKDWANLMERFRGMGPVKIEAVKEMISRSGFEK